MYMLGCGWNIHSEKPVPWYERVDFFGMCLVAGLKDKILGKLLNIL